MQLLISDWLSQEAPQVSDVINCSSEGVHLAGFVLQVWDVMTKSEETIIDLKEQNN